MEQTRTQKILLSLPLWWAGLTVIYICLNFIPGISALAALLGLFVPIGIWNFIIASGTTRLIVLPLVILAVFGGEYVLRKLDLSPLKKFLIVALILFLLTIAVDFIIWGRWQSLFFLMGGGNEGIFQKGW